MMEKRSPEELLPRAELILFLACVAVILAPLALRGTSCGQDFDFHLQSWMEAARQWQHGVFYPHWLSSANYRAGEPRFVFYPPLSWMLGALLGTTFPWIWTPILFTTTCLFAMGAACYKMASEWAPPRPAALSACFYVISPYIFFVIYERSACAELLAGAWLPLLILYALRERPSTPQLALIVAALWFTNAPAAVMGSYALPVIAIVAAISQRRWTLLVRAASALALGLGLAAVYIIPATYEQRWIQIARVIMPGMRPRDSFLFEHTGLAYHDQVLRTASYIATITLVATLFAALASLRARKPQPLRAPLIALAILIAFLQFPISKIVWTAAPELRFLQFPWRWLLVLGLIFAVLVAISLRHSALTRRGRILLFIGALAFATVFTIHAWRHFWLYCDDEDNIAAQIATLHGTGFQGTDEYTPSFADTGNIQLNLAPVRFVESWDGDEADSSIERNPDWQPNQDELLPAIIQIQRWQPEHMTAEVQTTQPGYALFRLMDYPAWRVRVNGKLIHRPTGVPEAQASEWREAGVPTDRSSSVGWDEQTHGQPVRNDGLLIIPIPAGTSTVDIQYSTTPDMWIGRIISLIALALILSLRRKTPGPSGIMKQNASRSSAQRNPALRG
jgi:hypothetical protein